MNKPCSKCGKEPRYLNQRWGKNCRNAWMRDYRKRTMVVLRPLEAIEKKLMGKWTWVQGKTKSK